MAASITGVSTITNISNPSDGVFATLAWDGHKKILLWDKHIDRLKKHCQRLSIKYPQNFKEKFIQACTSLTKRLDFDQNHHPSQPPGLLRINLSASGIVDVKGRQNNAHNGTLTATITEAPRWDSNITGTKHADWEKYIQITNNAHNNGFGVALLIAGDTIVDGDCCTPLLLDQDGTAWACDTVMGGVESITLDYVKSYLDAQGIPLIMGKLTAKMILRSEELVVLGTGIGVAKVTEIDGTKIGRGGNILYNICSENLTRLQIERWVDITGG